MRHTLSIGLMLLLCAPAVAADSKEEQAKKDVEAVKAWLGKQYANKKWQAGPTRLDSTEVNKAYGGTRIYHVFSAPPLPPGAPLPELLKDYEKRAEDFRANYISALVKIDDKGNVTALKTTPADLNEGLMKVTTDDEARTAAAAILSLLHAGRTGPGPVGADIVTVKKTDSGWTCEAEKRNAFRGTVTFDRNGKVVSASKQDATPLPP